MEEPQRLKPGLPPLAAMRPNAARLSRRARRTTKAHEDRQGNRRLRRLEPIRGRLPPAGRSTGSLEVWRLGSLDRPHAARLTRRARRTTKDTKGRRRRGGPCFGEGNLVASAALYNGFACRPAGALCSPFSGAAEPPFSGGGGGSRGGECRRERPRVRGFGVRTRRRRGRCEVRPRRGWRLRGG